MEPISASSLIIIVVIAGGLFYGIVRKLQGDSQRAMAEKAASIEERWENKMQKACSKYALENQILSRELNDQINEWRRKHREILSQKKRTEVRCGHILEKVAPLLDDFPADMTSDVVIPMFGAVDYLVIDLEAGIFFVEVKSNNASLSFRQKKVKQLIEEGKVFFKTYRKKGSDPEEGKDDQGEEKESS
jgi:predicted Holliday junction resolvase-like endonuclease